MSSPNTNLHPYENPVLSRAERIEAVAYDYTSRPKERQDRCNLCGHQTLYTLVHHDRYGFPAQADACTRCGLTFLNPRMTAEAYGEFYESVYRPLVSAYHGRTIDAKTVQHDQRAYTQALVDLLQPHLATGNYQSLLDVGGSTGIVAAGLIQAYGLEATLIDPAPAEVEEAKALGIESITAFVEDWEPGDRKFDLVGMFQTIDHLLDLSGTFKKMRTLIRENGLMLVDIVDYRHAYLRSWSIEAGIKIDHPYYLTESSTECLLARTGFQPIRKVVSEDKLHILYICKPVSPKVDALPAAGAVQRYLQEIRYVQGTAWKRPS